MAIANIIRQTATSITYLKTHFMHAPTVFFFDDQYMIQTKKYAMLAHKIFIK